MLVEFLARIEMCTAAPAIEFMSMRHRQLLLRTLISDAHAARRTPIPASSRTNDVRAPAGTGHAARRMHVLTTYVLQLCRSLRVRVRVMNSRFHDRRDAGRRLAAELRTYAHRADVLVLA